MSMHTRISVDQTLHGTASLQIHPGLPRIQRIDEFDAAKEGSRELAAHNIGAKERGALLLLLWMQVLSKLLGAQKLSDAIGNITCRIDDEERSAAPSSAAAGAPEAGEGTISTAEKQLRAIQKKLRQCEALQVSLLVAGARRKSEIAASGATWIASFSSPKSSTGDAGATCSACVLHAEEMPAARILRCEGGEGTPHTGGLTLRSPVRRGACTRVA